jgi:hypothetical protein
MPRDAGSAGGAPRAAHGVGDSAPDVVLGVLRPGAQVLLGDLQVADDDGEQVVEVVRNPAGQLADGLELLRLPQPLRARTALICF